MRVSLHLHRMTTLSMDEKTNLSDRLLERVLSGDEHAVRELFTQHHERLRRMVRLRLSRRLQGRVDEDDILQEAYIDIFKRLPEYAADPRTPVFLWFRHILLLKVLEVHRRFLGTQMRDAEREVTLYRGSYAEVDSVSLACFLLGTFTSPSHAATREELRQIVQDALDQMDEIDREILAMKHFEQLSTSEIAHVLGMSKSGAGSRYLRAIKRLRESLSKYPEFEHWS